ncbi:precorrin-6A/cobalt-precorrin-6A reductase [Palleronia sp. LCG004]|uniref:precorrin-6A/cobalt-precorrin-6A reductase n=1 Tax=Palleronia sp. LCG004 TaxID=3079304 RepID=UPI002943BB54|nr:precorrin-6A/cobalt-precorrin-6A reductase [Palleronia sp. LCG004]WOI54923.1 precorrin-6A/cobalt-precorrin-6A reductase [Palleronia sp. LCG004]
MAPLRILLLAGTPEARHLAAALGGQPGMRVTASLAGPTAMPEPLGVATRIGGFGGRDAFAKYLGREGVTAVLDATHPFAAAISHRSAEVCAEAGIAYAQVLRPAWRPREGDRWTFLNEEADAARHVEEGARVMVETGRRGVQRFGALPGRIVHARVEEGRPGPFPFERGGWIAARPTTTIEDETRIFRRLGIDWLIMRNLGGSASRVSLDAARALGLRVAMIRRPLQPEGPKLETVAAALTWARRRG